VADMKGNAKVVVVLEVEVTVGSWGPDCTIQQAVEQAVTGATLDVSRALMKDQSGRFRVLRATNRRVICEVEE